MKCIKCMSIIPDDSEFCPKCGHKIDLYDLRFCRKCGKEIELDSGFCRHCGEATMHSNVDIPVQVCETCQKPMKPEWDKCPNCSTIKLSNTIDNTSKDKLTNETHREARKKLTKKIIGIASAFVATAAIASILIVPQYYSDFEVSNLEDGTLAISGYHGDGGDIVIPEKLHFKTVTAIDADAFNNNDNITEVVLPNTIKSIDTSAFFDCDKLFRVVMTNSVDYIGKTAFANCDNLVTITGYGGNDGITPTKTDISVTTIDDGCFSDCRKLTDIVQADNIGVGAYGNCTNLKGRLKINAVKIGTAAFSSCTGIRALEIIADEIDSAAFEFCNKLIDTKIEPRFASQPQVASDAFVGCSIKDGLHWITDSSIDISVQTIEDSRNLQNSLGRSAIEIIDKTKNEAFEYLIDNYSKQNCEWGGRMYYSKESNIAFIQSSYTGVIDKVIVYGGVYYKGYIHGDISPNMTYRELFEVLGEQTIIPDDIGKYGFACKYGNCILSFVGSSDSLDSSPEICYICLA
ncbi:MAG: leucine-rich repeat protein [Oscillospiraceae bacterium]|nr:leucine-rich repeat protein [Oscillospiraceae bacterium]